MWCSQTGRSLLGSALGMKVGDPLLQTPQWAALGSCSGPGSWQGCSECRLPSGRWGWGAGRHPAKCGDAVGASPPRGSVCCADALPDVLGVADSVCTTDAPSMSHHSHWRACVCGVGPGELLRHAVVHSCAPVHWLCACVLRASLRVSGRPPRVGVAGRAVTGHCWGSTASAWRGRVLPASPSRDVPEVPGQARAPQSCGAVNSHTDGSLTAWRMPRPRLQRWGLTSLLGLQIFLEITLPVCKILFILAKVRLCITDSFPLVHTQMAEPAPQDDLGGRGVLSELGAGEGMETRGPRRGFSRQTWRGEAGRGGGRSGCHPHLAGVWGQLAVQAQVSGSARGRWDRPWCPGPSEESSWGWAHDRTPLPPPA